MGETERVRETKRQRDREIEKTSEYIFFIFHFSQHFYCLEKNLEKKTFIA